jgi:hypothetical protein
LIRSIAKREVTFFSGIVSIRLLVERVIGRHVGDDDTQHVVDIAGHAIELHHLRHGRDALGEFFQPGSGMVRGLDLDEDGEAEPDLLRRDQRDALHDHARLLEPLDALPAWRLRQPDTIGQFRDRDVGVVLQHGQNFSVDRIHSLSLSQHGRNLSLTAKRE